MDNSRIIVSRMKGAETYSAIAFSALLGAAAPVAAIPPIQKQNVYHFKASSPTRDFEFIEFTSNITNRELFPVLPQRQKAKARVKNVRMMDFTKDLFD